MNRIRVAWFVRAVLVLGVAAVEWIIANLLPSKAVAAERNNVVPWFIAWSLVTMVVIAAFVIAAVLVWIGMTRTPAEVPVAHALTPAR
jgi:hypothetical protein